MTAQTKALNVNKISESPEIFITDDNIAHTQESQNVEEERLMVEVIDQDQEKDVIVAAPSAAEAHLKQPQERRRSERLKKDITLTTKEKNERMARKRNLEGTYSNQNMFSVLPFR